MISDEPTVTIVNDASMTHYTDYTASGTTQTYVQWLESERTNFMNQVAM